MYKYQLQGKKEEKENTQYTVIDEIKENDVPNEPYNQKQQQVSEISYKYKKIYQVKQTPRMILSFIVLFIDN